MPQETSTITETPARKIDPIRSIDYTNKPGQTFQGKDVYNVPVTNLGKGDSGGSTSGYERIGNIAAETQAQATQTAQETSQQQGQTPSVPQSTYAQAQNLIYQQQQEAIRTRRQEQYSQNIYNRAQEETRKVESGEIKSYSRPNLQVYKDEYGITKVKVLTDIGKGGERTYQTVSKEQVTPQGIVTYETAIPKEEKVTDTGKIDLSKYTEAKLGPTKSTIGGPAPLIIKTTFEEEPSFIKDIGKVATKVSELPFKIAKDIGGEYKRAYEEGLTSLGYKGIKVGSEKPEEYKVVGFGKGTVGAPDYTKPGYVVPAKSGYILTPTQIGTAVGTGLGAAVIAPAFINPVSANIILGTGMTGGVAKFLTGTTAEERASGVGQFALNAIPSIGSRAIKGVNRLLSTDITLTETTGKILSTEPRNLVGASSLLEIGKTNTGNILTRETFPVATTARTGSEFRIVKVESQPYWKSILGKKPSIVYEGNPFVNPTAYKEAKELLTGSQAVLIKGNLGKGITSSQATQLLRMQQPKITNIAGRFTVEAYTGFKPDRIYDINGKYVYTPEVKEIIPGLRSKNFKPFEYKVSAQGIPLSEVNGMITSKTFSTMEKSYLESGRPFSKIIEAGKTTTKSIQLSESKSEGIVDYPFKNPQGVSFIRQAELYNERALTRTLKESGKLSKSEFGTSKTFVIKNEQEPFTVFYEQTAKVEDLPKFPTGAKLDYLKPGEGNVLLKDIQGIYKEKPFNAPVNKPNKVVFTPEKAKAIFEDLRKIYEEPNPASSGFFQQVKQQATKLRDKFVGVLPKAPTPTGVKLVSAKSIISEEIPTYVGGEGGTFSQSQYGVGYREFGAYKEDITKIGTTGGKLPISITQKPSVKVSGGTFKVYESELGKTREDELQKSFGIVKLGEYLGSSDDQGQQQQPKQDERQIQIPTLTQVPRLQQRIQNPPTERITRVPYIPIPNKPIGKGKPPVWSFKSTNRPEQITKSKIKTIYLAETRRFGKFRPVGKSTSITGAFNIGVRSAKENLARSVKVVEAKTGKEVKIPVIAGFRSPKSKNPFIIIQKNPLSARSEVSEIQSYRRGRNRFGI